MAGLAAVGPGFFIGVWAVLLIPTAGPLLGPAAVVGGLALPVAAIWLGRRSRGSRLGQAGWVLGWLALLLVLLAGVFLFTLAPPYFRL